jgi:hypothetical protein
MLSVAGEAAVLLNRAKPTSLMSLALCFSFLGNSTGCRTGHD